MFGFMMSKLRMELKEARHAHKLEIDEKTAQFERQKQLWEKDKLVLESDLKHEYDLKQKEMLTLTKLDYEQKIKQLQLDYDRKINQLENKQIKEMADYKQGLLDENYKTLQEALNKLHTEGNSTTKFTQELALQMMGSQPKQVIRTEHLTGQLSIEDGKPKDSK